MSKKVEKMQKCRLNITTVADGKETNFSQIGEIERLENSTHIRYRQEDALVSILLKKEEAQIIRQGAYSLSLRLKEDEETLGTLGIQNSEGELRIHTRKLSYSQRKDSLLLSLRYALLFGSELQEMKLNIFVKIYKD